MVSSKSRSRTDKKSRGKLNIAVPGEKISEFCRRNQIRKLAFFGSVLRDDFGPQSDVDVLVEFKDEHVIGFIGLASLEIELSAILGRKVDIRTSADLSRYFRKEVLDEAEVAYVA